MLALITTEPFLACATSLTLKKKKYMYAFITYFLYRRLRLVSVLLFFCLNALSALMWYRDQVWLRGVQLLLFGSTILYFVFGLFINKAHFERAYRRVFTDGQEGGLLQRDPHAPAATLPYSHSQHNITAPSSRPQDDLSAAALAGAQSGEMEAFIRGWVGQMKWAARAVYVFGTATAGALFWQGIEYVSLPTSETLSSGQHAGVDMFALLNKWTINFCWCLVLRFSWVPLRPAWRPWRRRERRGLPPKAAARHGRRRWWHESPRYSYAPGQTQLSDSSRQIGGTVRREEGPAVASLYVHPRMVKTDAFNPS